MITIDDQLLDRTITLVLWAVHQHVQCNGTAGQTLQADSGWEDAYAILEDLERTQQTQ